MKLKKRSISALLVLAMVIAMISSVSAAGVMPLLEKEEFAESNGVVKIYCTIEYAELNGKYRIRSVSNIQAYAENVLGTSNVFNMTSSSYRLINEGTSAEVSVTGIYWPYAASSGIPQERTYTIVFTP